MAADIQAALVAFLQTRAPITELLGASPKTRIYPEFIPADVKVRPAMTYTLLEDNRLQTLGGKAAFGQARVQLDVWGLGSQEGHKAANAVYLALWGTQAAPCLDGYRGLMGDVFVQRAQCSDGAKQSPEQAAQGKSKPDASCSLVVTLQFNDR